MAHSNELEGAEDRYLALKSKGEGMPITKCVQCCSGPDPLFLNPTQPSCVTFFSPSFCTAACSAGWEHLTDGEKQELHGLLEDAANFMQSSSTAWLHTLAQLRDMRAELDAAAAVQETCCGRLPQELQRGSSSSMCAGVPICIHIK